MEGGVTPFSSSMAPSGSYILIVVSQPLTEEHKQIILQRLEKGLLSWDVSSTGCDLSGLEYAFSTNIKDSVTESDVLIQHSTESLGVEVLLSPTVRTLKQCVKNLLSTPTCHKQLIHAGYTFAGSGSWILENGTFSFAEFLEIFQQANVQIQKRCIINVHCAEEGDWSRTNFARDIFTKAADVALNPPEKVNHVPGSEHLIKCLNNALITQSVEEMMKPSPLVGNIRFNRPTIYMFPAGQGDCALFGINGFNMLIDGGFHRKPCSWDFVRHLDRLDAVLVTRIGESNVCGMSTLMKRNSLNNANPQIGYVFCNIAENKSSPSKNGTTDIKDSLVVSVVDEGHNFVQTLNDLKLKPHQCWRDSSIDPFVLYHKVGQGTLEMHVLSPPRDSKEMKLFLSEWNAYKETFSGVKSELKGVDNMIPLSHATSICAILVWRPEDPKDTITRILFPGSAPQNKILEGLEKLKVLNILNHPIVTKASLNIPSSKVISNKVEKSVSRASIPNRNHTASPALSASSIASRNGDIGAHKKDVKEIKRVTKEVKKEQKDVRKEVKKEIKKDTVKEIKKEVKSENTVKKDSLAKKEPAKDAKKETKEVKKVIKKENKDVKTVNDKKEVKSTPKKDSTTPTVKAISELKKATSVAKKSTTPVKKDAGKPPIAPKATDGKKAVSKVSEPKTAKDVNNKKSVDTKTITKTKPKSTTASTKTPATSKTKPVAVPKPGSKVTKAVAASSIVASAVAVTVAAVGLNEKKEAIEDTEPEISEKEVEIIAASKESVQNEKSNEDVISPLPPEALSPTPSESVSLTPSDTLSSAPLETVSPTPPLPNEPISTEEKDVNEIKDLEQDMPYEQEKAAETEVENDDLKPEKEVNDIEAEIAKHQASSDVMSTSFIAEKQLEGTADEEPLQKAEFKESELAPLKVDIDKEEMLEKDDFSAEKDIAEEKDTEEEKIFVENNIVENENITKQQEIFDEKDIAEEKDIVDEKDIVEEKEIVEENDIVEEKEILEDNNIVEEKGILEEKNLFEEKEAVEEKNFLEENKILEEKDLVEEKNIMEGNEAVGQAYSVEKYDIVKENEDIQGTYLYEEKDVIEEKYFAHDKDISEHNNFVEKNDIDDDIDVIEEKDNIKEKDIVEEKNLKVENDMNDVKTDDISDENEFKNSCEENIKGIDDQLAGLSMEGSFCAGMVTTTEEDILSALEKESTQIIENNNASYGHSSNYASDIVEEHYEKKTTSESESYFRTEVSEPEDVESKENEGYVPEELFKKMAKKIDETDEMISKNFRTQQLENHENISQESYKMESDLKNQISDKMDEIVDHDEDMLQLSKSENKADFEEPSEHSFEINEPYFEKMNFSHVHSMEASFHQDRYEDYEPTNIDDLEMQETSVDEPEEIVRKESVVSITLNDENPEEHYADNWRRKSGTESEDDVDIGKYMSKEQNMNEDKLCIQRGSDSDEEDVVKSPTPHAVVDYEGQLDELTSTKQENNDNEKEVLAEKEIYSNEKEDFDEKDRDSAEEQDTDDGEMIRHPTPPEMKYSEEEMRDPIGQHFITNPSLHPQSIDITDQPLYEEAEDSASERSVSPIIEQPVFGNTVEADFPELVTVSGGTTPSEPQSPKANFDNKKFSTEAAVMDALSEHDISESSTHSPSCQDGSTAFDLQGSERSVIEVQSLHDEEVPKMADENEKDLAHESASCESHQMADENEKNVAVHESDPCESGQMDVAEQPSKMETVTYDDKDDKQEDKQETPSDEEESSSEDENSESHSKDKSDAMGDRSDVERDDRSDIHNDDKSDHHHDKSDIVNDDDDKSDIHEDEQLYRQQNKFMEHETEDGFQRDLKTDFQDEIEMCYDNTEHAQYEKQVTYENQFAHVSTLERQVDASSSGISESHYFENTETEKAIDERNNAFADDIITSNQPLNPYNVKHDAYENEKHADRNTLEYGYTYSPDNYGSNFQYESCVNEEVIRKEPMVSDTDFTNTQAPTIDETESKDKIEDDESAHTFQKDEADFENSKPDNNIYGFNTFARKNEIETTSVELDSKVLMTNMPDYSQELPSGFDNSDNFKNHEGEVHAELHEDVSPAHTENVTVIENKILSEITEAHQYENLSQYEEGTHVSHEIYSESNLTKNIVPCESQNETHFMAAEETNISEIDFTCVGSQMQSFTNNSTYEYSSANDCDKITEISGFQQNASYNETDIINESYSKPQFEYEMENTNKNFNHTDDFKQVAENYLHSGEQYMRGDTQFIESHSEKEIVSEPISEHFETVNTEVIEKNSFTPEDIDVNSNDTEKTVAGTSEFALINGKDQTNFSLPSSELTADFFSSEISHKEVISSIPQQTEQESTYLINNRFHSDSPEDNTMRSDSSPDVPYPVDLPDKFADMKNSMSIETSETYIHNSEDYKNNMNFSSTDAIPLATQNHSLNANQNNTYAESSGDESGSPVRGNVSPYAYTNKAYTREEEDIDGNHIYKEETTEVIKQVEFDGNNLQTLGTNQVSSVLNYSQEYQDVPYSTGANYDFHLEEWGKPMGLPTPPDSTQKTVKKTDKVTVKSKTAVDANGKAHSPSVSSKLSSPLKKPKPKVAKESSSSPIYVDLAYVPQHADPQYCDVEFFKKIRARYYVISSVNPSKEVLNALLEAKKTWNEDLSVTIIPTYETDTLGYWMAQNQNDLAEYSIDVSPSASRCTVNLQDHQTSCSAYRLEF